MWVNTTVQRHPFNSLLAKQKAIGQVKSQFLLQNRKESSEQDYFFKFLEHSLLLVDEKQSDQMLKCIPFTHKTIGPNIHRKNYQESRTPLLCLRKERKGVFMSLQKVTEHLSFNFSQVYLNKAEYEEKDENKI